MLEQHGQDAEYEYHAKLDSKTTKTCRGLNGKVFKVKDMQPGVNAPPMHPFCRVLSHHTSILIGVISSLKSAKEDISEALLNN